MSDVGAVTVTRDDGRLIAVRSALEPEGRARLRHEAAMLAKIDHPGVVRLVDHEEGPPARLRTAFVGPDSWRTHPPTGADVAEGLACVAAILADMHEAGVAHGGIRPDHVLVDVSGRPVLCGLADAAPARAETIATDIADFVALGRDLAPRAKADEAFIGATLTGLESGTEDLRSAVRGLDRRSLPGVRADHRRLPSWAAPAGAAAMTALLLFISLVVGLSGAGGDSSAANSSTSPPAPPLAASTPAASTPAASTLAASTPAASSVPAPAAAASSVAPPSTIPATAVEIALATDAPVVEHDGRRYALGRRGDSVITGDWNCDGVPTPAVLRPETGEIAVFAAWPDHGSTIAPSLTTIVEDALTLTASDAACPTLRAMTPTGSRLVISADLTAQEPE